MIVKAEFDLENFFRIHYKIESQKKLKYYRQGKSKILAYGYYALIFMDLAYILINRLNKLELLNKSA